MQEATFPHPKAPFGVLIPIYTFGAIFFAPSII